MKKRFSFTRNCMISIVKTKEQGYGVFTQEPIPSGASVLVVPQTDFISKENILKMPEINEWISGLEQLTDRQVIMMFYIYCKFSGEKNGVTDKYKSYVEKLSDRVLTCLGWDPESIEYKLLRGTGLDSAVEAKDLKLFHEFQSLGLDKIDCDQFAWADFIYWSRCMETPAGTVIVPMIDFCNHSLTPNAHWELENGSMHLITNHDLEQGEQITISYGEKSDNELLFLHGFALAQNTFLELSVSPPFIEYQMEEDEDGVQTRLVTFKSRLLQRLELERVIKIHAPVSLLPDKQWNPTCGLISDDTFLTLFVCMMTPQDGFILKMNPDIELEIHAQPVPIEKTRMIQTLQKHPLYNVLVLRIWSVLQQIVQYHLDLINETDDPEPSSLEIRYALICRNKQISLLNKAILLLEHLIETWAGLKDVQAYLQSTNC
ncbi:hypothetical protein EDD86DRAFT_92142 [Gorgonomyces haynaldii]|nr:hypothetical protein EDD86DRAFT_92142 [Gorgonomyces haynaldii]